MNRTLSIIYISIYNICVITKTFNYLGANMSTFITITEALHSNFGYLNLLDTANFLKTSLENLLLMLENDDIIYLEVTRYTLYPVITLNTDYLKNGTIRIIPCRLQYKYNPYEQILISSDYIKQKSA